ncbi:MAG TPA: phosphatase PAP2 family protein [Bryobacteraceae bacterium]|nr:phosphatase PAP2 family protein [Bryobacteraceae bacterium]
MKHARALRPPEIIFLCYFIYTAALAGIMRLPHVVWTVLVLVAVAALIALLIRIDRHGVARDWVPLGLVIIAYREMNWFTRPHSAHSLETGWQTIDRALLGHYGLRGAIEAAGWPLSLYLELCYLFVYATGFIMMWVVYAARRRDAAGRVLTVYLTGTLLAYAMFPFFPSDPPRVLFTDLVPTIVTPVRRFNLWIVSGAGIHSSVFPSAHVSSAFSAAFALLLYLPGKKWAGWGMFAYACSVAVATVYGRYHYSVDAVAGLTVAAIAAVVVRLTTAHSQR